MPTEISYRDLETGDMVVIGRDGPLPVAQIGAVQVGRTGDSEYVQVPGIATGAAYQDLDAFGTTITFPNVMREDTLSGQLYSATYLDLDKEALQIDLWLFKRVPTYTPTDNGAYAPTDSDLIRSGFIGVVSFASFSSSSTSSVSVGTFSPIGWANAAGTALYGQCVARGAQNIAVNNLPMFRIVTLAD